MKPLQILLVEDNEDDVVLLKELMEERPQMRIMHVANDGDEAIEFLKSRRFRSQDEKPDIILLDINMPRRNGFDVLEEIKRDEELRSIPVVMLTTSGRDEDIRKSYNCGACSFITKPIELRRFREIISAFEHYWTHISRVPDGFALAAV